MLCDILRGLEEFGEHLAELGEDSGALEELDTTTAGTAGGDAFDLTVQELRREPAGDLMITTAIRVFVGSLNTPITAIIEAEVTGEISRGKDDGAGEADDHGVYP